VKKEQLSTEENQLPNCGYFMVEIVIRITRREKKKSFEIDWHSLFKKD
jgi:hypothetical protein